MEKLDELTAGLSMGKIGDFDFYMDKNEYQKITKTIKATHGTYTPVKGQETLSDAGGYIQTLSVPGVLVLQPLESLKTLEDYTKNREPLRFTTLQEDIEVVIPNLTIVQEHFTDHGEYTVQTFNLSLKEVYDEF